MRWVWRSSGHDVVPDGADWSGSEGGGTTTCGEGHELLDAFDVSGQYDYYCAAHRSPGTTGSFTVAEE